MKKTAKAAVFKGANLPFEVREFEVTPPPKGYAQIKLIASGICGTDIHIHRGKLAVGAPSIIGHEFVGEISALNPSDKTTLKTGDKVIVCIAVPCKKCKLCMSGNDANCVNMQVTNGGDIEVAPFLYGGYSELNYSPLENLIPFPADLDGRTICTFACPGPTAIHSFELAKLAGVDLKNIDVAVVQGAGPVGVFAILYLQTLGIKNIISVVNSFKKERTELLKKAGATDVLTLDLHSAEEIARQIYSVSDGLGADLVFEASGAPLAIKQGIDFLRNRGVYLIPGQYSNSGEVSIAPQLITFKALHIIGSSQYSLSDVKKYVEFVAKNKHLHALIDSFQTVYDITEINAAFDDAKAGKNIKTMLVKKS